MNEAPVVNASPLIYLPRCGLLELLRFREEVLVPAAVAEELQRRGPEDPAARAIATTPWLKVVPTPSPTEFVRAWDLGHGETSVLAWAVAHPGSVAILDDLAARRCAEAHAIPHIGTPGIVLRAKRKGRIPAARPAVVALRLAGFYLSDTVMNGALALVDE